MVGARYRSAGIGFVNGCFGRSVRVKFSFLGREIGNALNRRRLSEGAG